MSGEERLTEARLRLAEAGARTSQELGAGRIVGQVMVHLYLQKEAQSLDSIGEALALSKASISIAVRQLEQLGFVRRIWVSGDRKKYYRSADNIGSSLQQGLLAFLRQKAVLFGAELDAALELLGNDSDEAVFLRQRISRAKKLQSITLRLLGNPVLGFLAKNIK
ncbi:MAG: GbsR/MarR family transcriptional regulator [Candidatus Electronema sp. V4]|uniref:GbsR/MarR family transcriptional regulator n=1 Tax=Candidatus Electronema sp. V4 TaxID=3454756 RepID=UPI0040553D75